MTVSPTVSAPEHRWVYRARQTGVVDGDTIDLEIDMGFRCSRQERVRLLTVDARETRGTDRPWGLADKLFVTGWFVNVERGASSGAWSLLVETELDARDKYGRLLARIWDAEDGACLNDALAARIAEGGPAHGHRPPMRATPVE